MRRIIMICMGICLLYFALGDIVVSACDYGEALCPRQTKTIAWSCPAGHNLVVRAFWGRESGDVKTCVKGLKLRHRRTQECPGDDTKAIAAVSSWCDANVNEDGQCVVKAPRRLQKLRFDGEKYDPCPWTLKYLKVCTWCECVAHRKGVVSEIQDLPSRVVRMTRTSAGDLAITGDSSRIARILTTEGKLKTDLNLDGSTYPDIARQGDILFIVARVYGGNDIINVIKEDNTYVATIQTGMTYIKSLAVKENKIWLGTSREGLFELTFDAHYSVVHKVLLVPHSDVFNGPVCIHALPDHIIVLCERSNNIHYIFHNGTEINPPVGETHLSRPFDFVLDGCGYAYVIDYNGQISIFSNSGKYMGELGLSGDQELQEMRAIHLHNNYMYIAFKYVPQLAVIKLQ